MKRCENIAGAGWYDRIVNKLTGSNLKEGEMHPVMWVNGRFTPGQFMGPGSRVYEKTKAGVEGVSEADRVSHRHDLAYGLAKNYDDIRKADLHMIERIKEIERKKLTTGSTHLSQNLE